MNYVGISCGYHDAAITVVSDTGNILFASHSERYSKVKHDNRSSRSSSSSSYGGGGIGGNHGRSSSSCY